MYDLGIIGGVGPAATVEIFRRLVYLTAAESDQEHMQICIANNPRIPDRTEYILGRGPSPLPALLAAVADLKKLGCKHFILPCNTAHIFAPQLGAQEGIIFLDMIELAREYLKKQHRGWRICVLGTEGTAKARVYGEENAGEEPEVFYPDPGRQAGLMEVILSVKGGSRPLAENRTRLGEILEGLDGCRFLLACTELSLVMAPEREGSFGFIDAMDILAVNAIARCGYRVKTPEPGSGLPRVAANLARAGTA
jgi:aspartate racemase